MTSLLPRRTLNLTGKVLAALAFGGGLIMQTPAQATSLQVGDATITVYDRGELDFTVLELVPAQGGAIGFTIRPISGSGSLGAATDDFTPTFEIVTSTKDQAPLLLSVGAGGTGSVGETVYDGSGRCTLSSGSPTAASGSPATTVSLSYAGCPTGTSERDILLTMDIPGTV